jgi:hypothetical protein
MNLIPFDYKTKGIMAEIVGSGSVADLMGLDPD